jgi:hypothetical protein
MVPAAVYIYVLVTKIQSFFPIHTFLHFICMKCCFYSLHVWLRNFWTLSYKLLFENSAILTVIAFNFRILFFQWIHYVTFKNGILWRTQLENFFRKLKFDL